MLSSTSGLTFASRQLKYFYTNTSPEKTSLYLIKNACKELLKIDSILLDKVSMIFGRNYILRERFLNERDAELNERKVTDEISKAKEEEKW